MVKKDVKRIKKIKAVFSRENVIADRCDEANDLYDKSRWGEVVEGKLQYILVEALFLLDAKKMSIKDYRGNKLKRDDFVKKVVRFDKNFNVRYAAFKDLRKRGYIVKTALKFGADFRVYDRGIKPGEDHAKWVVFPVHENNVLTWREFSAKNRVAHSTRKSLLLAIVDDENDVTYYQTNWIKP